MYISYDHKLYGWNYDTNVPTSPMYQHHQCTNSTNVPTIPMYQHHQCTNNTHVPTCNKVGYALLNIVYTRYTSWPTRQQWVLQDTCERVPEGQHETAVLDTGNMDNSNIRINSNIASMMSSEVRGWSTLRARRLITSIFARAISIRNYRCINRYLHHL
jgi:hypothetical protein